MKENELQGVESKLNVKLVQNVYICHWCCVGNVQFVARGEVSHLEQQLREVTLQLDSSETKLEVSESVVKVTDYIVFLSYR